jgi:hypothetical protein
MADKEKSISKLDRALNCATTGGAGSQQFTAGLRNIHFFGVGAF